MTTSRPSVQFGLGVPSREFDLLRDWARAADDAGFSFVTVGDNPSHMRDTYVSLTVLAEATRQCRIGTATTNPVHRDVLVVASALSSVETLAPGRVFLGLGRGRAHRTASVEALRTHIVALRSLWNAGEAVVGGRRVTLDWGAPAVPIFVAGSGPRVLRLAGELADGVIIESGVSDEAIRYTRGHVADGARAAGHDVDEIDVWWYVKASIAHDATEATELALSPAAASGALVLGADPAARGVPERFRDGCRTLLARYDKSAHLRSGQPDDPNRPLLDDLDLRRYLFDRFTIAGTPGDWVTRIDELRSIGVERLFLVATVPDPGSLVRLVGESVMPNL